VSDVGDNDSQKPEDADAPVRVCPACSAQSKTFSDTCPHCGSSFIRSRSMRVRKRMGGWNKRRKITAAVIVAVLIGAAVGVGVVLKVHHDNQVAAKHTEEREAEELAQAERAAERAKERAEGLEAVKLEQEERQAEEELKRIEVKYGHEIENELEEAITKDANGEAEEGFSEYVSKTNCEPQSGRINASLAAQNFSCMAVTSEGNGVERGYRYSGTINYLKGSMSWHYGG
jgi:hypothetical protein